MSASDNSVRSSGGEKSARLDCDTREQRAKTVTPQTSWEKSAGLRNKHFIFRDDVSKNELEAWDSWTVWAKTSSWQRLTRSRELKARQSLRKNRLQSSLSQPAIDAGAREATGVRRAAARPAPVPSRTSASIADWERKKGLLCSLQENQQLRLQRRREQRRARLEREIPVYMYGLLCFRGCKSRLKA